MSDATGQGAVTLHRLLEFDPKAARSFKLRSTKPIEAGAIIVDETSMVDVWMADALTQAVADGARLILVGDVDQLQSVGPSLGAARCDPHPARVQRVRLVKIFRQAEQSLIVQNAHRINAGAMPYLPEKGEDADFFIVDRRDADAALKTVIEMWSRYRIPATSSTWIR